MQLACVGELRLEFRQPGLLKQVIGASRTVFVDEVQRIPSLLNTVQYDGAASAQFAASAVSTVRSRSV